jgi:hypothetical protein
MNDTNAQCLFIVVSVGVICILNFFIGRSWNRLDHNPWSGKFLGGTFSTPSPGLNPGSLDVTTIRRRGRVLMRLAPIVFCMVSGIVVIYLVSH